MYKNIVIVGTSGSIGSALIDECLIKYPEAQISAFSRKGEGIINTRVKHYCIDYTDESALKDSVKDVSKDVDLLLIAIGILHDGNLMPEKSFKEITLESLNRLYYVNTILPTMIVKTFIPLLNKFSPVTVAALSARVGSISDNKLGGWYSYRASKAALNMIFKSLSIEIQRINKESCVITLHPGTVDSNLSKPFQNRIKQEQLFTPKYSAQKLVKIIDNVTKCDTGKVFAWDGSIITP